MSVLASPASHGEIERAWQERTLPDEVAAVWSVCREAPLYVDADYGQWGLLILNPEASARRTREERAARPSDFADDDIVLGEFLGDQELLVIAPAEAERRRVLVALPLDPRRAWFGAGRDLGDFLTAYFDARGEKYWERDV